MDRDEFMELVYETFADEPDNVLSNGIIEAADAYVEHEKAKLSQEDTTKDTTSDMISRQAAIDEIKSVYEWHDTVTMERLVDHFNNLPSVQPVATDTNVGDTISRQWLMECVNEGWIKFDTEKDENRFIHLVRDMAPTAQPEPAIPLSWVEKYIEWLKGLDNEFANLAAAHISVMVKKWRGEQHETD